jgi:hypothetical protein
MTYLIVGLDRQTLAPWHQNVHADDATTAAGVAVRRARGGGVDLVVAAVIGPNLSVVVVAHGEQAAHAA